jgi:hypothetical protein
MKSSVIIVESLKRNVIAMNRHMQENDNVGILIGIDKDLYNYLKDHVDTYGFIHPPYVTNDPRMLKALKLIGYETVGRVEIQGIERFMYN